MKTAEEWKQHFESEVQTERLKALTDDEMWACICHQIQLDAKKEGMRRAAIHTDTVTHQEATIEDAKQAILSAADQLTLKDLCPEPTKNP